MRFTLKGRRGEAMCFTEIDAEDTTPHSIKLRLAVDWVLRNRGKSLTDLDLAGADLSYLDLDRAYFNRANLFQTSFKRASLDGADFSEATLHQANLTGAVLCNAVFTNTDLRGVHFNWGLTLEQQPTDFTGTMLTPIRDDFWAALSTSPANVPDLIKAIANGRIDGDGRYIGKCDVQGEYYYYFAPVFHGYGRPVRSFFLMLTPGTRPENSQVAQLLYDWAVEWLKQMRQAFAPAAA